MGATIAVEGTLRSRDRDMFIQSADLTLLRKDRDSRSFEWGAFRNAKAVIGTSIGQSSEVAIEAPSSFMVAMSQPYRYNILFMDVLVLQMARPILESYRKAWLEYLDKETNIDIPGAALGPALQKKLIQDLRHSHQKFTRTKEHIAAFDFMNKLYYWEAVHYQVILNIRTARPNRTYRKTWFFNLTSADVINLRNNVISALEELAQVPLSAGIYSFAYPTYFQNA
ncbi:MAG: hypothetical protein ACMG6H_05885 [Acidobacteriota bacterium]